MSDFRHGFNPISEELMAELVEGYFNYFTDKRHDTQGQPINDHLGGGDWRVADRQRTVNAALVMCLNLGVDPPDIIKTQPCARLEAWVDPQQFGDSKKALEQIGKNLQQQYESLSTRTKFKQVLDPMIDDIKRFCLGLRRSARDDRILFHYNGHGVPKPTPSGEIWMFNRGYTQYIPVSVYELQNWLGAPVIYCYDCSGAGNILNSFDEFVLKRKQQKEEVNFDSCIQLGSCMENEILPMNPQLPADLFTCCLTTPVDIAIKWFLIQNQHSFDKNDYKNIKIPGKITDRRTPLGELNWIFTAITDTIAWSVLDPTLFKRLFRQDLIVATLFRNFLLACRIMRAHNCHPCSSPKLPKTYDHPLWDSWDAAVNKCLLQCKTPDLANEGMLFSDFFEHQLTAFELWLNYQCEDVENPPHQLPILLQVLLSQIHRVRALTLLCRYLDLGPKAVRIALSIGFFIYVLKLLQSPSPELQPVLVFIWARTLAVYRSNVDKSVQSDLMKEGGYNYFVKIINQIQQDDLESSRNLAMCSFVLAQFVHNNQNAKTLLLDNEELVMALQTNSGAKSPLLRQWSIMLLSELTPLKSVTTLLWRLKDPIPEVRCAVLYAMTSYLNAGELSTVDTDMIGKATVSIALDGSPMVRHELVVFLSKFISICESKFIVCAYTTLEEEFSASRFGGDMRSESPAHGTVSLALWRCLLVLTNDAMPFVRHSASLIVDHIQMKLMRSPLSDEVHKMMSVLLEPEELKKINNQDSLNATYNTLLGTAEQHLNSPKSSSINLSDSKNIKINKIPSQNSMDDIASPSNITSSLLKNAVNWIVGSSDQQRDLSQQSSPLKHNIRSRQSLASLSTHSKPSTDDLAGSQAPPKKPESVSGIEVESNHGDYVVLKSQFRDFSIDYFREPQLKPLESDEPGSKQFYERLYRKSRNEKIMSETQQQKTLAVEGTWSNQIASISKLSEPARKLKFAQFEPHIVCAGKCDLSVFDWESGELLNRFHAGNSLADVEFLNEDDQPMVLTASRDGMARVFKHYDNAEKCSIVSAWWVFADLVHHQPQNPSVYVDWQQSRGHLLAGGDARVIRVWDLAREQAVGDIPVRTSAQLTALTSDKVAGNLVFAGFNDGSIQVYDRRLDKQQALVRRWKPVPKNQTAKLVGHNAKVINLQMQRGGTREVASGSVNGEVRLWDIRNNDAVGGFKAHTKEMRCMDLHEHAPVIATASRITGIWSTSGRRVSTLRGLTTSYLSSRILPIGAVKFHPHKMILATADSEDGTVSLFKCV